MSILLDDIDATFLLECLAREEANVATAAEEVERCLATVNCHKERVDRLRAALNALGIDPDNSQVAE